MVVAAVGLGLSEGSCDRAHLHQLVIEIDVIMTLSSLQQTWQSLFQIDRKIEETPGLLTTWFNRSRELSFPRHTFTII